MVSKSYYDFQERTGELESSGNYSAKNNLGYKGKYQFGVAALMDAGYYKGDKDGGWNNHWDGEWTGKDGIYSIKDFMNSPKAQDNAFRAYNKRQWGYLMHAGLEKYIGKEINGIVMTPARMLAGAHLVGQEKMIRYIKSNGKEIFADDNGVSIERRMKEFEYDYDVSEITGIPHRDYIEENRTKKYEKVKPKYTPKELSKMSKLEFFLKEKDINKDQEEFRKKVEQMINNKKSTGATVPLSHKKDSKDNDHVSSNNPSKHINFNGIRKDGVPWKNWSEKEQKGFLEGLIGKSLDSVDNDEKRNWTSKFNICNPNTDDGHWVRSRCRRSKMMNFAERHYAAH